MSSTEEIALRVKQYREDRDLSQQEFSDLLGVSRGYLGNIESARSQPSRAFLQKLLDKTDVNTEWILTGEGSMKRRRPEPGGTVLGAIIGSTRTDDEAADAASASDDEYALVPYYDIALSGGHGAEVMGEAPKAHNAYRKEYLRKRGLAAANLAEFTVRGDSMAPELCDGDTVLVDRTANNITSGGIFVLRIGNQLAVKYVQRLPGGDVQVTSENSKAYPPYTIPAAEFEHGHAAIIGRVVRQGRDR